MNDKPASIGLDEAYAQCLRMARSHYENFPVASRFVPAKFRNPIAVIYAFARSADDFADEGDLAPQERLEKLDDYRNRLQRLNRDHGGGHPIFIALHDVIARHNLPRALFEDLLTAFTMDVTTPRYDDFSQVLGYCRYSANPVGRLLLHLYDKAHDANLRRSDDICTALQLINFLQDIQQDLHESNRIYLPRDAMARHGVSEADIREGANHPAMKKLVDEQLETISAMLRNGAPLGRALPGRIGLELRLTIAGAKRIVARLEAGSNPYARPRLTRGDWLRMLWQALAQ